MNAMLDQLIIGKKASLDDFDASLKTRTVKAPKKKTIKETVPFSNVTYDFSAINGEVYWEERELEYVFEIIADNPEELECKKASFFNWVMNVMEEEIYDPYEPGWHYVGTFADIDHEDDESVEKTTITVLFTAYPYKVADELTIFGFVIPANSSIKRVLVNKSSHRIVPTLISSVPVTIKVGSTTYNVPAGEVSDSSFMLEAGTVELDITNPNSSACTLNIEFYTEVF